MTCIDLANVTNIIKTQQDKTGTEKERDRERDRQTDRQRDRQRQSDIDREREKYVSYMITVWHKSVFSLHLFV